MGHDYLIQILAADDCFNLRLERKWTHWPDETHRFWNNLEGMEMTISEFISTLTSALGTVDVRSGLFRSIAVTLAQISEELDGLDEKFTHMRVSVDF